MEPKARHIAILCSYLHVPGGYEKAIITTANLFAEKGLQVTLLILDETAELYYPIHKNISVVCEHLTFGITKKGNTVTRKLEMLSHIRRLKKILLEIEPTDIIVLNTLLLLPPLFVAQKKLQKCMHGSIIIFIGTRRVAFGFGVYNEPILV
jgi:hypothetical protein